MRGSGCSPRAARRACRGTGSCPAPPPPEGGVGGVPRSCRRSGKYLLEGLSPTSLEASSREALSLPLRPAPARALLRRAPPASPYIPPHCGGGQGIWASTPRVTLPLNDFQSTPPPSRGPLPSVYCCNRSRTRAAGGAEGAEPRVGGHRQAGGGVWVSVPIVGERGMSGSPEAHHPAPVFSVPQSKCKGGEGSS